MPAYAAEIVGPIQSSGRKALFGLWYADCLHEVFGEIAAMWSLLELLEDPLMFTIVDIGAALGEEPSYQSLVSRGAARIFGFEPNVAECERLNALYGPPHRFFPYFIGQGGYEIFHETTWNLTGSLFEPNHDLNEKFHALAEAVTLVARHPVKTTRLDDVEGIDDIDFIKIDIQGAELSVFQNAPRLLERTLMIQTEVEFVEIYKDQPLFADVDRYLRGTGFQFHTFQGGFGMRSFKPLMRVGDPNNGFRQLLWSDAVYVRDWMRLDLLSLEKLKKFAVLLHDLMGSFDLCHAVLDEVDRRTRGNLGERYLTRLTTLTE